MTPTPGYFVGNNDRLVQLRSGRILFPVAFTNYINHSGIDFVYYSDDDGKTWQASNWILPPDKECSHTGLQEPGVIELHENDHIMCWSRTAWGYQYKSFSRDGGIHWTAAEPAMEFPSILSP